MSDSSILLISADDEVATNVTSALEKIEKARVSRESSSVSQLNGAAVAMAADHDVVIFATDPSNAADLTAIELLTDQRKPGTIYLALTDGDLPLSKARALSRAGVDDVLPYPLSNDELVMQVNEMLAKKRAEFTESFSGAGARNGHLFAVQQARGGVGATTIAVNLADQLLNRKGAFKKEAGNKVVIVDFDLQFGTVGDFLDVDQQEGLLQLASENFIPDAMWIEQSMTRLPSGLAVLAAPSSFVPLEAMQPAQIEGLIKTLKTMFDYVVVDLPRALVNWIEPVLAETDQLLIVTDMTVPAVRATRRLMEFVLADNAQLPIEVVINHEKKPMILREHHREAAKALDVTFHYWIAHDPKAAREAVDYGKPLSEVSARSDIAKGIALMAKSILTAFPKERAEVRV
ncbi:AAA family ATPase [Boseongicola aestuarii]|uniref:Septum site-determining protein MinD n=1 Tax=Boseongicola aestuarii TaxID=1470561 RepID=A0A238IUH6_9RHOB|nr:AAA family ATPase [Boseongicola aestuarii]SMX22049.1 Septum site-determining protein MinD [Boseongicola aestuarii]